MQLLTALRKQMEDTLLDAVLLWSPGEIFCFTGCVAENACAVITPDTVSLIVPEGTATPEEVNSLEYREYGFERVENPRKNLLGHLTRVLEGRARTGVTGDKLNGIRGEHIPGEQVDITEAVNSLMDCKPESFLPLFRKAQNLNAGAYAQVAEQLRPGMSELDLYQIVAGSYLRDSGRPVPFTGDFLSGARAAEISGGPTSRVIETGDAVIVDALVALDGAHADTTRTFFMGPPDRRQQKAYAAVERALRRGEALLRPGVEASAVYRGVSASLEADGYPPLPHHAGHGVGYTWYERPYFIPGCRQVLRPGMLVTLEPGVYIDGSGVRLENNYRITGDGAENLFHCPLAIERYII